MIKIDEAKVFGEIARRRPRRVVFNGPDGLLAQLQELVLKVQAQCGVEAILLAEACFGSCDTADYYAKQVGADLAFHVGHTISLNRLGERTVFIDAFDDVSFEAVLAKAAPILKPYSPIGLATTSQHLPSLPLAKQYLEAQGIDVRIGRGGGQLRDGQVFGCEFYPVYDIRDQVRAFALLAQSPFHAVGVALSTGKPTYMLDPYLVQVVDVGAKAEESYKRAVLAIYKALDARRFCLILGLREGQMDTLGMKQLKAALEKHGREVVTIALRDITEERLSALQGVDAFIQTACPRISTDDHFTKPVLSVPQAEALLRILEGGDPGSFLERRHWL